VEGVIAERYGTRFVLALGTALAGIGYVIVGASAGLALLAIALFLSGLGSSTQHPLASSLVARAFAGPRSLKALGTYNFIGDVGKMTVPLAGALLLTLVSWRSTVVIIGACGIGAAVAIAMLMPRFGAESATHGVKAGKGRDIHRSGSGLHCCSRSA
jgi:FSR family fosmidomycin resistance protein-like MFS transporter